jgi:hypothetical protein
VAGSPQGGILQLLYTLAATHSEIGTFLHAVGGSVRILMLGVFGRNDALPKPMLAPHVDHLLNWHILGLRQEEVDENCHDDHPTREEEEDSIPEVTQDGEERLCDDEGEQHVGGNRDTLAGRPSL